MAKSRTVAANQRWFHDVSHFSICFLHTYTVCVPSMYGNYIFPTSTTKINQMKVNIYVPYMDGMG